MTAHAAGASLPLEGIRVVDFSRLLPGPWCTQMLADLGADVIKIEQPGAGDPARHNAPNYRTLSVYFCNVNRGKRSIALDLSSAAGKDVALRLIDRADVLVESFRRGVTARLGLDPVTARARNPRLIYCSITGFGQTGPMAAVPGHDLVIQAMTGLMNVQPVPDAVPPVPGFQAADYAGGTSAVSGILAALLRRSRTGEAATLDISMFDSLFAMGNITLTGAMARQAGWPSEPGMEVWGRNARYSTYRTRDGKAVAVSLLETRTWERFCRHIGRPDLISEDESLRDRHSTHGERAELFREALTAYFAAHDRDAVAAELLAVDVPICPVSTPDEALVHQHVADRGLISHIEHPSEGTIPCIANPLAKSGLAVTAGRPAPPLGADTDAVLAELGFAAAQRSALYESGVVA